MTLGEWAGQAYVAAHLSPCFEPETDDDAGWEAVAKQEIEWSVSAITEIIRAAAAEERAAAYDEIAGLVEAAYGSHEEIAGVLRRRAAALRARGGS